MRVCVLLVAAQFAVLASCINVESKVSSLSDDAPSLRSGLLEQIEEDEHAGCVPYSEAACRAAAKAGGLSAGGAGFSFSGNYGTKGCYTYSSGTYANKVYFGTGGTAAQSKASVGGSLIRPAGFDCAAKPKPAAKAAPKAAPKVPAAAVTAAKKAATKTATALVAKAAATKAAKVAAAAAAKEAKAKGAAKPAKAAKPAVVLDPKTAKQLAKKTAKMKRRQPRRWARRQ